MTRKQKQQININEKGEITMRAKTQAVQIRVTKEDKEKIVERAKKVAQGNITRYLIELVEKDIKYASVDRHKVGILTKEEAGLVVEELVGNEHITVECKMNKEDLGFYLTFKENK